MRDAGGDVWVCALIPESFIVWEKWTSAVESCPSL